MSVDDNYREALRKSAEEITPGNNTEYFLRIKNPDGQRVEVESESVPSGLSNGFFVTTIDVGTSATLIPTTPLDPRNAIAIYNTDSSNTLYIGPSNTVTADNVVGSTSGWEVGPNEIWQTNITKDVAVYGISTTTIRVKILELG